MTIKDIFVKVKRTLHNPYPIIEFWAGQGKLKFLSDKAYLKLVYRARIGKKLNLNPPISFNEKLQWLKLHDRKAIYSNWVDKVEAKKLAESLLGSKYIIPNIGVYSSFSEIDVTKLPKAFVIKCTHDSGGYVICKNKDTFDFEYAREKISSSLKKNYFWSGREWPYKNIEPRILIEKYMKDIKSDDLTDYKLMCFNGKVKCIFTCTERFEESGLKVTFFSPKWEKLPFYRYYPSSDKEIEKPKRLGEMINIAEKLASGIPFVRVDLYDINDSIYFGEMTFYPGNGFEYFCPDEWDNILGDWLDLSQIEGKS